MAVQQLGPEASRAGARRARALAARAGGPTVALVALSTVTVTSVVAIAFAPLPHSVTPGLGLGGGVAAPANVRPLATPTSSGDHTVNAPTGKKTGTSVGPSFTGTAPAVAAGTTAAHTGGSGTTHHGSSGGKTTTTTGTGSKGGGTGPTRPGGGGGSGSVGSGGGTGVEGGGPPPTCDPNPTPTPTPSGGSSSSSVLAALAAQTATSPILGVGTTPCSWHAGGGTHIILPPVITGPDGSSKSGSECRDQQRRIGRDDPRRRRPRHPFGQPRHGTDR